MRQSVLDLRRFYATPLGRVARRMISRKIDEVWADGSGLDVLALGYATPFVEGLERFARRIVASMPAAQGVEPWPLLAPNCACLAHETALPFPNAFFDRILLVHALEESDNPLAVLAEACRVLAPSGRMILAATARRGPWADAEDSPFGHGRPFSRSQLERLVREAELTPLSWTRALYAPPLAWTVRWADGFEQVGAIAWPAFAGVFLMEATKQTFAMRPKGRAARAPARLKPVFAPSPAPVGRTSGISGPMAADLRASPARPPPDRAG